MLFRENKLWAMNGRFTYVAGHRGFVDDETAFGTNRIGTPSGQQIFTLGNAERPAATGNLTFSLFPGSKLTLTNQTSVYNIRMEGDSYFTQVTNGIPTTPFYPFTYLGIRTIANSTVADFRLTKWFAVRAGYEYSNRRIGSIEGADVVGLPTPASERVPIEQVNGLSAGLLGMRFYPTKHFEHSSGRRNRPCGHAHFIPSASATTGCLSRANHIHVEIVSPGHLLPIGLQHEFGFVGELLFALGTVRS